MNYLKLETESHSHPYTIGQIKDFSIKVIDLYHVSISTGKFYQDIVGCDVVDMNTCILLERSWPHDIGATDRGKENIYMFPWKGKRVVVRPISLAPNLTYKRRGA